VPLPLRADVNAALLDLGVRLRETDTGAASLARAREFVNDLYTWELRRLRGRLMRGHIPKPEYASRVESLRLQRYWVLSVPLAQWCAGNGLTDGAEDI
jgi:hypothetical protein